jgi:hypothetical protein
MKTGSKILISGIVIFLIALTGGIAYSLEYNSKPVVVLLSARAIEIRGMYGLTIEHPAFHHHPGNRQACHHQPGDSRGYESPA